MSKSFLNQHFFTDVIVSELAHSYQHGALGVENFDPVDFDLARRQHDAYVDALRATGVNVTVLPADEAHPDCVFVEDPAFIIGNRAVITKPGHPDRTNEIVRMRPVLESFGLEIHEIKAEGAKVDGGDVQYTGKEILVGLSERTNQIAVDEIARIFPELEVIGIEVSGPLHLKTLIGLLCEDTFCVSKENGDSIAMFERIQRQSKLDYKCVLVPNDTAANTIFMNGHVICKGPKENPEDFAILQREVNYNLIGVETSEIEKAVGSLTCMSLRFNRRAKGVFVTDQEVMPVSDNIIRNIKSNLIPNNIANNIGNINNRGVVKA